MTPSRSRISARTPRRAARREAGSVVGITPMVGCHGRHARQSDARSTDGTARRQERRSSSASPTTIRSPGGSPGRSMTQGAEVGFSSVESLIERARPAAGRLDRLDLRRAMRRPVRRADRGRSSRAGPRPTIARHPGPCPGLRPPRGSRGRLRGHVARRFRAGAGRFGLFAAWRWRARRGRCCAAARRS